MDRSEDADGRDGSGELYRRLVETSSDFVVVLDTDGKITYANAAVERVLGHDREDVLGDVGADYTHPDDQDAIAGVMESLQPTSTDSQTTEVRVQEADGSWCWISATMQNRCDDDVIDGFVVHGRAVTDRKQREAELLTTKERMSMALEGANLGIWDWDMETDEVERDELLTEMLGYTQSEMGEHLRDWEAVVHPEGKKRHDEALAEHIENQTPHYH